MSITPDKKKGKPTGRWYVEVQRNKQRLRGRFDTFEEAKDKEKEFIELLEAGKAPKAKPKFSKSHSRPDTLAQAIEKARGRLWRGKSVEEQNFVKLAKVLKILGDRKLEAITTGDLDDLVATLQSQRKPVLKDATINRYLTAVSKLLKWCVEREYRVKPMPIVPWLEEDEGRIRWITFEEERELLSLLPDPIDRMVRAAIRTGMRRGEFLTLRPEQVVTGWIHLYGADTKNGEGRSVPIDSETYEDLHHVLKVGMPTAHQLRHHWDFAREAMGLMGDECFVFHACRHTCATRLVMADVNLATVKEYMGHKTIETTLRYAHVTPTTLANALNKMNVFISRHSQGDPTRTGSRRVKSVGPIGAGIFTFDRGEGLDVPQSTHSKPYESQKAGVAELVDALVLGTSRSVKDLNDIAVVWGPDRGEEA